MPPLTVNFEKGRKMVSHIAVVVGCILFACGSLALGQEHSVEFRGCLITETAIIDRAGDVIIGLT
jgi:hypothetical protein